MNLKQGMVLAGAVLAVTGCGGSSNDKNEPHAPYVEFRVNGQLAPKTLSLNWYEINTDDDYGFCDVDRYDNAADVISTEPAFCEKSMTNITFSVRFTNSTYEPIDVSYDGLGFEVHIYEYDDAQADLKGDEVWNSSYLAQRLVLAAQETDSSVPDFDPAQTTTVELDASDSLPNYANFYSIAFEGDKIFDGTVYDPVTAEDHLLKYPTTQPCDWVVQVNDTATAYRYVRCFGEELLPEPGTVDPQPVKFVATVTFNFNGWTDQPDDIIITINPPE